MKEREIVERDEDGEIIEVNRGGTNGTEGKKSKKEDETDRWSDWAWVHVSRFLPGSAVYADPNWDLL